MQDRAVGASIDELERAASAHGLSVDDAAWCKIDKILELLTKYGRSLNLTGAVTPQALTGHVLEALLAVGAGAIVDAETAWVDVGSGGGFPGLIVACCSSRALTLIEPRERRAAFLELALNAIGRSDVAVRRARLVEAGLVALDGRAPGRERFGVASARAVFGPEDWLVRSRTLLTAEGVTLVHGGVEAPHSPGFEQLGALAWGRWVVRAYVPHGT